MKIRKGMLIFISTKTKKIILNFFFREMFHTISPIFFSFFVVICTTDDMIILAHLALTWDRDDILLPMISGRKLQLLSSTASEVHDDY